MTHVDVLIIGAGLSGIGAARQLQDKCPGRTFAILESRDVIGGTWDLFRYPGVRSDSDMYTMGYDSKPWLDNKAIADGSSILNYVKEAASERGLEQHIHLGHKVESAAWSSEEAQWIVDTVRRKDGAHMQFSGNMLFVCSGYYDYVKGYTPEFPGMAEFTGQIIHPQRWPENLDYSGKKVIVIGSGATAMTLIPALATKAAKVTMLQRSPTYVISMPAKDAVAVLLRKILPESLAYRIIRWKNVQLQRFIYHQTQVRPEKVKKLLLALVRRALGKDYDVDKHFTPNYLPWDQRLCLVPDNDVFQAIRSGKAAVATDQIAQFTADGITLKSGEKLEADIVVTATGLEMVALGGISFSVDGKPVNFPETYTYKGVMLSDVPNMIFTFGYINASWTLRSELVAEYGCRLVNHLHTTHTRQCTPRLGSAFKDMKARPFIEGFSPGYMLRAIHLFPKQGDRDPWRQTQNYTLDKKVIRDAPLVDGVLEFNNSSASSNPATSRSRGEVRSTA